MRSPLRLFGLLLVSATFVACGSTDNPSKPTERDAGFAVADRDGGTSAVRDAGEGVVRDAGEQQGDYYTWWQDVEPIVSENCQLCHANPPQFGAPRSFVTYADTQLVHESGSPVYDVMAFRINAPSGRMPPPSQPQLTPEQIRIITRWAEIGAPEGTPPEARDGGVGTPRDAGTTTNPDAGTPHMRNVSRTLEIVATQPNSAAPYEIPQRTTNYVCWSYTVPAGAGMPEYMFRFEPIIDNTRHTHHTLLFKNNGQAETDGVPFSCGAIQLNWNMVAGWAPGRTADEIPEAAGVPIQAGDQLILQVHYDSVTTADQTDQSGVRVLLTDDQNLESAGMLWCGKIWQSSLNGANEVRTHTWNVSQNMTIFAVFPHLHQLGTRIELEVQRGGSGPWTSLVNIPAWDFNDQPNVAIDPAEQQLRNGDKLRTTCEWNTQGRSVSFGEASDDEMCFNFVYHYPKIGFEYSCVGYGP